MACPLSPVNGQSSVLNGITYAYNSTKGAWIRVAGTVTATAVLSVTSATQSTSTTSGALVVTGGVGIGGGTIPGFDGGNGGSGVVIIRYPSIYPAAASTTGSPSVTVTDVYRIYQWTTVGSGSITY